MIGQGAVRGRRGLWEAGRWRKWAAFGAAALPRPSTTRAARRYFPISQARRSAISFAPLRRCERRAPPPGGSMPIFISRRARDGKQMVGSKLILIDVQRLHGSCPVWSDDRVGTRRRARSRVCRCRFSARVAAVLMCGP